MPSPKGVQLFFSPARVFPTRKGGGSEARPKRQLSFSMPVIFFLPLENRTGGNSLSVEGVRGTGTAAHSVLKSYEWRKSGSTRGGGRNQARLGEATSTSSCFHALQLDQ